MNPCPKNIQNKPGYMFSLMFDLVPRTANRRALQETSTGLSRPPVSTPRQASVQAFYTVHSER